MTKIKPKARAKCSCLKTGLGINSPRGNQQLQPHLSASLIQGCDHPPANNAAQEDVRRSRAPVGFVQVWDIFQSQKGSQTWPECWLNVSRKSKIPNSGSWWTLNLGKAVKMNENDSGLKLGTPRFQAQMSSELQGIWVAKGQEPIKATDLSWLSWF